MLILGIETSCDETSASIVENGKKIISNTVASSMEFHKATGGIIPESAAREQVKYIIPVLKKTFQSAGWKTIKEAFGHINAIAVTMGPGLNGSLLIGVESAKTISFITGIPVIPVNHIFAHIYANWLSPQRLITNHKLPSFPAVALVVSGGHTELFLMKSHNDIKWLGGTRDDAAGEAFDKTARILGLGYPGGPAIAAAAANFKETPCRITRSLLIRLPRPMVNSNDLNFSFSGLKAAVIREVHRLKLLKQLHDKMIQYLAYEIQESITDVLVKKTLMASQKYKVKSILLGGGVAANQRLTEKFKLKIENLKLKIDLHIPPPPFCTDNAAYIASFAYFHYHRVAWQNIQSQPDLTVEV